MRIHHQRKEDVSRSFVITTQYSMYTISVCIYVVSIVPMTVSCIYLTFFYHCCFVYSIKKIKQILTPKQREQQIQNDNSIHALKAPVSFLHAQCQSTKIRKSPFRGKPSARNRVSTKKILISGTTFLFLTKLTTGDLWYTNERTRTSMLIKDLN